MHKVMDVSMSVCIIYVCMYIHKEVRLHKPMYVYIYLNMYVWKHA